MYQVTENATKIMNFSGWLWLGVKTLVLRLVVTSVITLVVACGQQKVTGKIETLFKNESERHQVLRRGLPGEPQTLDPQAADDTYSLQVIRDIFEGLTSEDRAGAIAPAVAESWTVDSTGRVYTFRLRTNARWSDGTTVTAGEFVEGLRRAVDPITASGSAQLLETITGAKEIISGKQKPTSLGVAALDENSLQIQLVRPAPFILQVLSQPIAAPLRAAAISQNANGPKSRFISNGPYSVLSRVANSYIELARNPYYWDVEHVNIEKVRYINSESAATELREYFAEQLDLTFTIPMPDLKRVTETIPSEIQTAPILGTLYLAFNLDSPSFKRSTELRQALSMVIDRELISERVMLGVAPAYSLVAEGTTGYLSPKYDWSNWSPVQRLEYAQELYRRAGYSIRNPLHLRLYYNRDESIQRIMIAVAENWKSHLGVECDLAADEFRVFLSGRKDKARWDVARLGWNADYDDPSSFLNIFTSDSTENDAGYFSASFNEMMSRAELEAQLSTRMHLLGLAEETLLRDYPIIPIYFYRARRLVKPYIGGAAITSLNHTYTKHLFWK